MCRNFPRVHVKKKKPPSLKTNIVLLQNILYLNTELDKVSRSNKKAQCNAEPKIRLYDNLRVLAVCPKGLWLPLLVTEIKEKVQSAIKATLLHQKLNKLKTDAKFKCIKTLQVIVCPIQFYIKAQIINYTKRKISFQCLVSFLIVSYQHDLDFCSFPSPLSVFPYSCS